MAALFAACVSAAERSPLQWHAPVEVATGGGERGPWRQNESAYDYVDDPTVVITPRREILLAWVHQARKAVLFQRFSFSGAPLSEPIDASRRPATFSWLPRLAIAPDASQRVYLLWQEIIFSGGSHGGDILFARSSDGGATFSPPVNLSDSIGGDGKGRITRDIWHNGSLDIVAGPDGAIYAAWTEYDGPLWFSRSTDAGERFSKPRQLAGGPDDKPARAPALALGRDGALFLAWTTGEDRAANIRVAKSNDGGTTFGEPQVIAPSEGYSDAPKLAVDARGVLHLAYGEGERGPFGPQYVRYTRSLDGGRTFEPPRNVSRPLPPRVEGAGFPALAVDENRNVYVLAELFPDAQAHPRGLGMAVSGDGGQDFGPLATVPHSADPAGGTNGSHQGLLTRKMAVSDSGLVAIVNSSLEPGSHSRVWLLRGELPGERSASLRKSDVAR